jgi:hypothetical protein
MATYGTFFIDGILGSAKWPRKQGITGKMVVDTTILDVSIDQMVDWAAGIGAGRPKLTVQILGSLYNDYDWDGANAPNIEMLVKSLNEEFAKRNIDLDITAPHDILEPYQPYHFKEKFSKPLPYKILREHEIREMIEKAFVVALLYGFNHPVEFKNWYKNYLEESKVKRPTYEKIGMEIDDLPDLEEYLSNAEDIINLYVQESDTSLPTPHPKLLAAARRIRSK